MSSDASDTASSRSDETASTPPPTIPGYRMVRRLGEGGMAVVYLAVQVSLDREVAIKVMAPSASADEAQAQRFEHEARIIAKLEHPGIVGIHEVGRTRQGQLYYVMPYLAHGDLSQRDYHGSELRIIELLRGLLDALGYAHARGIVHRDVKAENVLFNNADRPQLTDFGIALSRRPGRARITNDGLALGSGGYMSPEQARGENVDGRADLYSLGVLTYELLTGELPYHAEDPLALALMHATDPVPRLPLEKAHWQKFIDTAMAKAPERRYRNSQAMQRALEPIARRLHPPTGLRAFMAHEFWRRPYGLFAAGAIIALMLSLLLYPLISGDGVPDAALGGSSPGDIIPASAVAPSAEETAAAIAMRLEEARALLDAGALIEPAGGNAAESYLAVLRVDAGNTEARAGLDQVVVALGKRVQDAIVRRDPELARERFEQARLLAESSQLQDTPQWQSLQGEARTAAQARAETSLAAHERGDARTWHDLAIAFGTPPSALNDLLQRIERLPAAGDLMRDRNGPELSYVPAVLGRSRVDAPFALMRSEVTRSDYGSFVAQTRRTPARCRNRLSPLQLIEKRLWSDPGFEQTGSHPVVCVSFDDARAYAIWLGQRNGERYRLPTLQEWRHAAQVSSVRDICTQGNVLDRSAAGTGGRYGCDDRHPNTAASRSYRANGLGLFDMIGNASEWTLACGESGNPIARLLENEACPRRAAAGVSWRDGSGAIPASHIQMLDPERGHDDVGFRLLREIDVAAR